MQYNTRMYVYVYKYTLLLIQLIDNVLRCVRNATPKNSGPHRRKHTYRYRCRLSLVQYTVSLPCGD